jgi:predicted transcriptional regulator of viral defense system
MKARDSGTLARAEKTFREHGGMLRTGEAIRAGIHPRVLYAMRDAGIVQTLSRGLYRLTDLPPLTNPDLVSVAARVPKGVVCLVSALAYHEITTQIPHEVYLALERGSEPPRIEHPPLRVFWMRGQMFSHGQESHKVDGVEVSIYSAEKTLADCFKYRNKIGLDVAVEAVRLYRQRRRPKVDEIIRCARICRVEKVMRPYLEAIL